MKKVQLIYNPVAGNKSFPNYLDTFIQKFQQAGYSSRIFRTTTDSTMSEALAEVDNSYYAIIVAGGDGSVNQVINIMKRRNLDVPLGVIPAGTANDFANNLNMPADFNRCFDLILNNRVKEVDLGVVNGEYFVNVCAGGLLSRVSHDIDRKFKNTLGKLAYYLKGIEQIPKLRPIPLRITTSKEVLEEEVYLFLVLNSNGAGGFTKLAPEAVLDDGLFDFIGIKARPLHEIAALFLKIIQGEHLDDKNVIYRQDNYFKLECIDDTYSTHFADVDGEKGPSLPVDVSLVNKKLKIFSPE